MSDLYVKKPSTIVMYSTEWCGDCKRAKKFLAKKNVPYINVDIEKDEQGLAFMMEINDAHALCLPSFFPMGRN